MTAIVHTLSLPHARPRAAEAEPPLRRDLQAIIHLVPAGTKVLDLGCGDGTLLSELLDRKPVFARGVEVSEENVRMCVARGLSVRQGNIEDGLADFSDRSFDFVILSRTIGYLDDPVAVLREMLRVGRFGIVSVDNGAHWRNRLSAAAGLGHGRAVAGGEPLERCVTFRQFRKVVRELRLECDQRIYQGAVGRVWVWPALFARTAVFLIRKQDPR